MSNHKFTEWIKSLPTKDQEIATILAGYSVVLEILDAPEAKVKWTETNIKLLKMVCKDVESK